MGVENFETWKVQNVLWITESLSATMLSFLPHDLGQFVALQNKNMVKIL